MAKAVGHKTKLQLRVAHFRETGYRQRHKPIYGSYTLVWPQKTGHLEVVGCRRWTVIGHRLTQIFFIGNWLKDLALSKKTEASVKKCLH